MEETEPLAKTNVVIWLHADHLSAANPALVSHPDAPVVFVFDRPFLRETQFGFGRLAFIYESVMDVFAARPDGTCRIRLGTVTDEVETFARERGANLVVTTQTVGSRFIAYEADLQARGLPVRAYPVAELIPYPQVARVPKRFGAWWREVESAALDP